MCLMARLACVASPQPLGGTALTSTGKHSFTSAWTVIACSARGAYTHHRPAPDMAALMGAWASTTSSALGRLYPLLTQGYHPRSPVPCRGDAPHYVRPHPGAPAVPQPLHAGAVTAGLGVEEIVSGISKRGFTPDVRAAYQHCGEALAALCQTSLARGVARERVRRASLASSAAVKLARLQYISSAHKKCAELNRSQQSSHAMQRALDSLVTCSAAATILTLRHPRTFSPCASPRAKADAFAAFVADQLRALLAVGTSWPWGPRARNHGCGLACLR